MTDPTTPPENPLRSELADVHYLPAAQPATEVAQAGEPLEGELVSEEEYQRLTSQRALALARYRAYRNDVAIAARTVKTVVTHQRTATIGKAVVRNVVYVFSGGVVVVKRLWDAKSNSRYERVMRTAEALGNYEMLSDWEQRAEMAKQRRHDRVMAWIQAPAQLVKALVIGAGALIGCLLALGVVLAVAYQDASWILGPITGLLDLIRWVSIAVSVAWVPLLMVAPWAAVLLLWHLGRTAGATPTWVMPSTGRDDTDVPITPSLLVKALRDLGIAKLRQSIAGMGDGGAGMLGLIRIAGCGVEVDVTLPSGVPTSDIQRKRALLAENLNRHEHELFITIPPAARTVRLWIADSGALDEPIGPSPLVTDPDATADLYTGRAPWGQDLRGDAAAIALLQRHLLITGLSNQGKTAALRALVLWLALDVTTELRIADLKGVGDWRMFSELATVLIQGPTDEHVIAATEMLEEVVREMERRIAKLEASGATDGVTRDMARSEQGFHPLFAIVDEAQVAFMCPAKGEDGRPYGGTKATSRYFMAARKIHNQGRAVNVHLWQGTQDPTDQNLPKLVREGAHIRAALVLGTEEQARMALGDKAVNGGAAPHKLRQGLDKGTLVVAGDGVPLPPGQASITIRTHFIDGEDSDEVATRAKARRGTRHVPQIDQPRHRDLLADVADVLDTDTRARHTDVVSRLRALAPHHEPYATLDGKQLVTALEDLGVRITAKDGYPQVYTERVHQALAQRGIETSPSPGE